MKLVPYARVDGVSFRVTRAEIVARLGRPRHEGRNDVDLDELDFGDVVFRFQAGGRLEEVTTRAAVIELGKVCVPFASLDGFVRHHDPGHFERAGFVVSPRFGIAFVPARPGWVTALAAHAIAPWRALRPGP